MKTDRPETPGDLPRAYVCVQCGKTLRAETPGDQIAISLHRIEHVTDWSEPRKHTGSWDDDFPLGPRGVT